MKSNPHPQKLDDAALENLAAAKKRPYRWVDPGEGAEEGPPSPVKKRPDDQQDVDDHPGRFPLPFDFYAP